MDSDDPTVPDGDTPAYPRPRRRATVAEAKAVAHPLRMRIVRLCGERELTNKQLAERLGRSPGTVLYHVRMLVDAGLLEPAPARTGESGALEKPYRSTGRTWWLDDPLGETGEGSATLLEAFQQELDEAGAATIESSSRFVLHLSPEQLEEFANRILAVLDEYVETDGQRRDQPAHGGLFVLHRFDG